METTATPALPRKKGKAGRILAIIVLVLLLTLSFFVWWRYYFTYSIGNKTYEGEMILSSVKGNANVPLASEKFFFSVTDDGVAQQMNNLQGRNITVHYREKNSAAFWRGDSPYIVDSVKVE